MRTNYLDYYRKGAVILLKEVRSSNTKDDCKQSSWNLIHTSLQRGDSARLRLWFSRFNGFPVSL